MTMREGKTELILALGFAFITASVCSTMHTTMFIYENAFNGSSENFKFNIALMYFFTLWGIGGFFIGIRSKKFIDGIAAFGCAGLIGAIGYAILSVLIPIFWLLPFYPWWLGTWICLGIMRSFFYTEHWVKGASFGFFAGLFSILPFFGSLIIWMEPRVLSNRSYLEFAIWWWITFFSGFVILHYFVPNTSATLSNQGDV